MADAEPPQPSGERVSLREILAGRRGRLLIALLFTEFGAAVQSTAYSSVLPIVSNDLGGAQLYGATLVAGTFTTILVLAFGSGPFARFGPAGSLLLATVGYVIGVGLQVGAVSMAMVLAGNIVRGLAGGLWAGFGLSALGALYDDALRPRVVGLFAVMWLLPSLVGPVANSAITIAVGWRAAMAWPAVLVLCGRFLIGRHVSMIPWEKSSSGRLQIPSTLVLLGGLIVAAAAPAPHNHYGVLMLLVGLTAAMVAALRIVRGQVGDDRLRRLTMTVMFLLCWAFFGSNNIVSLAAINALGYGIVAASTAVGVGVLGWAITGMRPISIDARLGDTQIVGLAILVGALVLLSVSLLALTGVPALTLLIAAWAAGGIGMGLAYNRIFSESVDRLPAEKTYIGAVAVEFADECGQAIGTLMTGGTYSLASTLGIDATRSLGTAFGILAAAALAGVIVRITRQHFPRPLTGISP